MCFGDYWQAAFRCEDFYKSKAVSSLQGRDEGRLFICGKQEASSDTFAKPISSDKKVLAERPRGIYTILRGVLPREA